MRSGLTQRGSAMTLVVFVATAVTVTAVAGIGLSSMVSSTHAKKEKSLKKDYVAEGAIELATSDVARGALELGGSKNYTIGGVTVTVTVNDNSAAVPGTATISVDGASPNLPVKAQKTVALAARKVDNIWSYGVFSNGSFTFPLLGSSKVVGSTFFRNSVNILGTGQITKDYKSSSSFNPLNLLNVGGAILTGVSAPSFPTLTNGTYQSAAATVLNGNQTLNGYAFPKDGDLVYVNGNLTLQGNISKQGTFYVSGSVTIAGNVQAPKKLAVITPGSITFNGSSSAITADGYYFSRGTIYLTDKVTLTGGLVGNGYTVGSNFTINWDDWATKTAANGESLKLPAMWP